MQDLHIPASTGAPLSARVEPQYRRIIQILLVEDHFDTAKAISSLLKKSGYDVKVAGSIADARKLAGESKIDLVICDIGLPDGTGLELMRQLKDRYGLKGICLSGYDSETDIAESTAAGFNAHLTKPVNIEKLESLIPHLAF